MSYWNRPFFPESCSGDTLSDSETYDTMVRIVGSFAGIAQAFKVVADNYGWKHIVSLSDEDNSLSKTCWMYATSLDDLFGNNENYTFKWLRLRSNPTVEDIDDTLQQIRSRTRGCLLCLLTAVL